MSKGFVYELILTPGEVEAIANALQLKAEQGNYTPFEEEDFNYAQVKVSALLEYVKADTACNEAEAQYKETLEKDRDAFKIEAF